jgi:hypothetical protein
MPVRRLAKQEHLLLTRGRGFINLVTSMIRKSGSKMDKIVPSKNSNAIIKFSSTAQSVLCSLELATAIFGKDLVAKEADFWQEELARFKPEHIMAAFRAHCRSEMFFPRPVEIIERIEEIVTAEAPSPGEILRRQLEDENRRKGLV